MPMWFNRDSYLKTLIVNATAFKVSPWVVVTSSGLIEFYIAKFWIVE